MDESAEAKNARLEFAAQTWSKMQGVEITRLKNGAPE